MSVMTESENLGVHSLSTDLNISPNSCPSVEDMELHNCGICLDDFPQESMFRLDSCRCSFCKECLSKYIKFRIDNGHLRIFCPSATCDKVRVPESQIVELLISETSKRRFEVLANNRVLAANPDKSRCPFCDHIFDINNHVVVSRQHSAQSTPDQMFIGRLFECTANELPSSQTTTPQATPIQCPNCLEIYCAACSVRMSMTPTPTNIATVSVANINSIDAITHHNCNDLNEAILNELDIKKCPQCSHLIQRSGGCAQISCRNCSHVFCWHCLASLDADLLLLHYDSGPCKNRLGHSRASILLNRAQTIGVCVGISVFMILASPVILITLPCLLGTKSRRLFCWGRKQAKKQPESEPV